MENVSRKAPITKKQKTNGAAVKSLCRLRKSKSVILEYRQNLNTNSNNQISNRAAINIHFGREQEMMKSKTVIW
jgi:hypothetical protein